MAGINKSRGRLSTDVARYKAVFGMDYDPPVGCSVKDLCECKTIEDRLALVPDDYCLKSFAQKVGELPNQQNEGEEEEVVEEEKDAHAATRKLYFEK